MTTARELARAVRRLHHIQRLNIIAFYLSFMGVFGGLLIGCAGLKAFGRVAMSLGFLLAAALVLEAFAFLPFLKCPYCGKPFFVPPGWLGFIHRVNPHCRRCFNCHVSLDRTEEL